MHRRYIRITLIQKTIYGPSCPMSASQPATRWAIHTGHILTPGSRCPAPEKRHVKTVSGSHADRSEGNSMADAHPHNSALTTRSHCPSSHTLSPMGGLMTVRANGDAVKQDVITGSRSLRTFGGATGLRHAERAITWCNPQLFLTSLSSVIFADATHVVPSKSPSCVP